MTQMAFNNRLHGAEVVGDDLVAMCRDQEARTGEDACDVLEAWDRKANLDSRGTHLFRAFFLRASGQPGFWSDRFDAEQPVTTPSQMNTDNPNTRKALQDAVDQFRSADVALDAPFGELQTEPRGDRQIPIHGSTGGEGAFNVISPANSNVAATRWNGIRHGSSFVQAVGFTDDCPDVRTIMTYSQSTDPTSRWSADQTERYSAKQWVRPPFCRADVLDQTIEETTISEVVARPIVERVSGTGRVETSAAVSRTRFGDRRVDTAVLARADEYPDALAGAPLAHELGAPLLLSAGDALSPAARDEIRRLGASRVVLLGGDAALAPQVEADLRAAGVRTVDRVAGPNRFATAAAIARRLATTSPSSTAFLAEGANDDPLRGWPDALSAAPYAAFTGAPVLLTNAAALPPETAAALDELFIDETVVVGGAAAVSEDVVRAIGDHGPRRVFGATRYGTSAAVWREATAQGMGTEEIWVATGRNWPDALAAGPAVAGLGASMLLVDGANLTSSPETRAVIAEAQPRLVRLVGGTAAISEGVSLQIRLLLR
jgi:putative cell wall-binding protein